MKLMAEALPTSCLHGLGHNMGNILMQPQYMSYSWAPRPDQYERDEYIGWLKSEFAAANAVIDSMCHHMHCIGSPGEYDVVFGCLNRRRHAWTPSLYMQHFFSVAEVVTALQEVAWKKHQGHHSLFNVNVAPCKDQCPSARSAAHDDHDKAQLGSIDQRNNTDLNLTANSVAESQQSEQGKTECFSTSNKDATESHVKATPETGEGETSHSPANSTSTALSASAECSIFTECDKKPSYIVLHEPASSTAHICRSGENNTDQGHINDQSSLEVKKLLNTEVPVASEEEDVRHAMIKRSLQFQCCEHGVDGKKVNDGESVELCENVFNSEEVDEIIAIICQLQAAGRQGELGCAFRGCNKLSHLPEILQFGPKLGDETKLNDSQCIPKFLQALIRWLTLCGILSPKRSPDSCLISIFNEGDFEAPNTDQGAWEKPLCVISLMEECTMVFGHSLISDQYGNCKGPFQVALPAGSVLLLRENFTGILQKAIPASPRRRITIALGRAVSTRIAELNCVSAAGKIKKHGGIGGEKQARLGMRSHPRRPLPLMQRPFPSMQPNLAGLMLPHPAVVLGSTSSAGTGVFFPRCDASVSWQSGVLLLSSTSLVATSKSVQHS